MFEEVARAEPLERPAGVALPHDPADFSRVLAGVASELGAGGSPTVAELTSWTTALGTPFDEDAALGEAELVDRIAATERLKAAAAARQARDTVLLEKRIRERRTAEAAGAPVPSGEQIGKGPRVVDPGIEAGQAVALARCESPSRGGRLVGLAKALVNEMPHTLNALAGGRTNEWRATLVARETACLSVEDRVRVDEAMVPVYARGGVGDRQLVAEARAHAQRLDPAAAVKRARRAESERRVTVRPAPDSMAVLSCLLAAAQAIAAYKALTAAADSARAEGADELDGRTRDQFMADTVVERLTGQCNANDVRIEANVVITDASLLGGSADPAVLAGYGMIPAQVGRDLIGNATAEGRAALRRLYTKPGAGALVAMESRSRAFPDGLKQFIATRDVTCLNPWCDAPIRQFDHVIPAA